MPFRDKNKDGKDGHPIIELEDRGGKHDIFFAAVELTRMPMILTDPRQPDNPIIFANVAFLEMTGYAADEIIGRNCRFLQGEGTDRDVVAAVRDAIDRRTDIAVEILNYRKDGSAFWNALFISPVFGDQGELLYYFASQLDVSRRRDAEDALRQAQKMEAVGQLTGGIAHDFNNLLTVVMGNIDSAARCDDDARRHRLLERAMEGARKAEKLTSQLLAFARKQRLETRPTSLNGLTVNMKDLLGRTLGTHIEIKTNLTAEPWIAHVDTVQAETALLNLVVNARDAMPEGGVVTLSTSNRRITADDPLATSGTLAAGDYSVLTVSDTGEGIPPEHIARVTEPFFTTKDIGKGTGMGLAMVYGFMRQSKGRLEIESRPGQGTDISLWFPSTEEQDKRSTESTPTHRQTRGGGETILVAEDNLDVQQMAVETLEDYGYTVLACDTGAKALDILKSGTTHIDMLFTDIIMPGGMNGIAVANYAKTMPHPPKILVTTGWSSFNGADDQDGKLSYEVLNKPYMPQVLIRKVREILDGPTGVT